jgi:hypothetical protein
MVTVIIGHRSITVKTNLLASTALKPFAMFSAAARLTAAWSCQKKTPKFNGCASQTFMLHLKECEFRFNHRKENLYNIVKNLLKKT